MSHIESTVKLYVSEPDAIPVTEVMRLLPEQYEVLSGTPEFSGAAAAECTVLLIRSGTTVTDKILENFPKLQAVVRVGVGLDNVDLEFCKQHDVAVFNAPGANADAVSDYIVCVILVALRNMHKLGSADVASWNRFKFTGHSMSARTIGIIGFGNIGRLIYKKLLGFEPKEFVVYDPYIDAAALPEGVRKVETIDEIMQDCDVVTLHVPLTDETRDLIDARRLALLTPGAVLINSSRGGIVNESAVAKAAADGALTYIADTVVDEPHPADYLLEQENIIITPHVGSLTTEAEANMLRVALQNYLSSLAI